MPEPDLIELFAGPLAVGTRIRVALGDGLIGWRISGSMAPHLGSPFQRDRVGSGGWV